MIRPFAAFCALLALAACNQASDQPTETAAPASAPATAPAAPATVGFDGDFNALGTEPFWAVEVRKTGLKLSRPGGADLIVDNPGPKVEGSKAVWAAKGVVLTLTEGDCSDGMSDRIYAYYAEVTTSDATMKGCATRPDALAPRA